MQLHQTLHVPVSVHTYICVHIPLQDYYEDLLSGKTDRHDLVIKKLKERCVCVSLGDVVGLITSPSVLHMYIACTTVNCVFVYVCSSCPDSSPHNTMQSFPWSIVQYWKGRVLRDFWWDIHTYATCLTLPFHYYILTMDCNIQNAILTEENLCMLRNIHA